MPPISPPSEQPELFRSALVNLVDRRHPLVRLAGLIDWHRFATAFGPLYREGVGRPGLPTRLMVGLHLIKHMDRLSDDAVCARFLDSPYVQLFCGESHFQHALPLDRSSMTRWRKRIGAERLELLLAETLAAAQRAGAAEPKHFERVTVDTTIQPKAVADPPSRVPPQPPRGQRVRGPDDNAAARRTLKSRCSRPTTYLRQREGGRIVSVAAIIAVACDAEGRREIVGLHIGPSEAETFWATFLKSLVKRGLRGVKLVVSDAHEGLKAAIARVLGATWQRCRVHWMRNALAHVGKAQQSMAAAALRQAFLQPDQAAARQTWRHVADQLRPRWPKLGKLMDDSEDDVLAYMAFPPQHRTKLHSVNTLERLNKEVKRRADVVGIFPSEASIIRLIGAVLLEANDEWQMQHRYMGVEAMGEMLNPSPTNETLQLPPMAP